MRMSRSLTLLNNDNMNYTTKLAIEFAKMIASGWTSTYSMDNDRNRFPEAFMNYNGAEGFDSYSSGSTTSDCSSFINTVWAVATATAYGAEIAKLAKDAEGRKMVPLSRGKDLTRFWAPSTDQMAGTSSDPYKGLTNWGFEVVTFSEETDEAELQPGDVCVIKNVYQREDGVTTCVATGHTFMILAPADGNWVWKNASSKEFTVVHCSTQVNGLQAIRVQSGWNMLTKENLYPIVYRYTYNG